MCTVNSNVRINLASCQRRFFRLAGGDGTTSEYWFRLLNIAHNLTHCWSRQGSDFILVFGFSIERCGDVYPVYGIPFISFSSRTGVVCDLCRRFVNYLSPIAFAGMCVWSKSVSVRRSMHSLVNVLTQLASILPVHRLRPGFAGHVSTRYVLDVMEVAMAPTTA